MKKILLIIVMLLLAFTGAEAQGYFKKLGKSVKDRTKGNVEDRAEKTVDKAVDRVFDAVDGLLSGKKKKKKDADEDDYDDNDDTSSKRKTKKASSKWDCPNPDCGIKDITGNFCVECGTKRPVKTLASLDSEGIYATKKITFQPGSTEIKTESAGELDKIADYIKNNTGIELVVLVVPLNEDPGEEEDYDLFQNRAESVVNALIDLGCNETSLKAVGPDYGMEEEDDDDEDALNLDPNLKGLYVIFVKK